MPEFIGDNNFTLMRNYFSSGSTRSYSFRKQQLLALKKAVLKYDREINEALFADLKKSVEEVYATETGLLIAEINTALKNLRKWMQPESVATNLLNLPSSSKIYREPLGIVLIIAPWNYPFQLALVPLVGAIAAGNCVVLKPSELSPATSGIIEKIIKEIYSEEYVRVIQGDGVEIIPAMMNSFRFDHIFFTGSIPVGKIIYQLAAKDLIPVTLELGGKSPAVVEADANIGVTARRIILGKFANAGQTCIAPDYILVDKKIKETFIKKLKETIIYFFGDDASASYDYGKIINEKRFDKLKSYLQQGKIIFGGENDRTKLFIAPTIMEDVSLDSLLMTEEIFGPILPIYTFAKREDAVNIIQRNPKPLSFYVFTSDPKKEKQWIGRIQFGGGCINNACWHFANHHLPFGGIGNSGVGSYHGKYSFDTFTHKKAVMKTATWFDPDLKYPPFKGKLKWFKLIIR
ncbi:MAG TPA: aldehyde dehydrogenase [Puia sp.]|nr:aldehyde dehydrogenase [Puia sp.]